MLFQGMGVVQFNAYLSICNAVTLPVSLHDMNAEEHGGEVVPLWVRKEAGPLGSYGGGKFLLIAQAEECS